MLEAIIILIKIEFNKSFQKVFTSYLPVGWPRLETLMRTITTRNFYPKSVVVHGGFKNRQGLGKNAQVREPPTEQQEKGGGRKIIGRLAQEAEANPDPLPELQVGPGFKLRLAMDMADEMMGETAPLTHSSHSFCLSCTLKSVYNFNSSSRNAHWHLFLMENVLIAAWKAQFCGMVPLPVL